VLRLADAVARQQTRRIAMSAHEERQRALVQARCSLGIAQAQYWRAQRLAETTDGAEREAALAEVRRLSEVGAALSVRTRALGSADG